MPWSDVETGAAGIRGNQVVPTSTRFGGKSISAHNFHFWVETSDVVTSDDFHECLTQDWVATGAQSSTRGQKYVVSDVVVTGVRGNNSPGFPRLTVGLCIGARDAFARGRAVDQEMYLP